MEPSIFSSTFFFLINLSTSILSLLCVIISVCTCLHLSPAVVPSGVHTLLLHSSAELPPTEQRWGNALPWCQCCSGSIKHQCDLWNFGILCLENIENIWNWQSRFYFVFYNFDLESNYVLPAFWELNCKLLFFPSAHLLLFCCCFLSFL